MVPAYASAAALLYVACVMARGLAEIDWEDVTEYAPAVVTAITIPLAFAYAYALTRSCMRGKIIFRVIALTPGGRMLDEGLVNETDNFTTFQGIFLIDAKRNGNTPWGK